MAHFSTQVTLHFGAPLFRSHFALKLAPLGKTQIILQIIFRIVGLLFLFGRISLLATASFTSLGHGATSMSITK
jgi:hypothetical protein